MDDMSDWFRVLTSLYLRVNENLCFFSAERRRAGGTQLGIDYRVHGMQSEFHETQAHNI